MFIISVPSCPRVSRVLPWLLPAQPEGPGHTVPAKEPQPGSEVNIIVIILFGKLDSSFFEIRSQVWLLVREEVFLGTSGRFQGQPAG